MAARTETELLAWKCPRCHRWHQLSADHCRCGFLPKQRVFSATVVALLTMAIGLMIMIVALQARDLHYLEQSGAAIEAEMVWGPQ